MYTAALNNYESTVKLLIDYETEMNAADEDKQTALHNAALNDHEATVKLLIEHRAEMNAATSDE